jgi:aminopeptidase-like protein
MNPMDHNNSIGEEMYAFITELFPICRSITGNGVRASLEIIKKKIPIEVHEIPSGTKVFDWEVPKEWNIKDAYIKNSSGQKILNFVNSNLHVLNYSTPIHKKISLE